MPKRPNLAKRDLWRNRLEQFARGSDVCTKALARPAFAAKPDSSTVAAATRLNPTAQAEG
jgi:hypothetical protein